MDLSKLTPAPWHTGGITYRPSGPKQNIWSQAAAGMQSGQIIAESIPVDDAEFIALARNAFDVMMRRGWGVRKFRNDEAGGEQWSAENIYGDGFWAPHYEKHVERQFWPDPFTALVEADKWYREHVESTPTSPAAV